MAAVSDVMMKWKRRDQKKERSRAKRERRSNIKSIWLIINAHVKRRKGA